MDCRRFSIKESGMKKFLFALFPLICLVSCSTSSASSLTHIHAGDRVSHDDDNHWHICDHDGERFDEEPHSFVEVRTLKEPTCVNEGKVEVACTGCGYVAYQTAPANGHRYDKRSYGHSNSYHWLLCDVCGAIGERQEHDFDGGVDKVEATCLSNGIRTFACKTCGFRKDVETLALGHQWEMSFDEDFHWEKCHRCGKEDSRKAHTWEVADATTHAGTSLRQLECSVCGYRKTICIEHHSEDGYEYDGSRHWKVCSSCGANFDEGEHDVSTFYSHDGESHWRECRVCHAKFELEVHDFFRQLVAVPDHFDDGLEKFTCKICGYVKETTLPKGEHASSAPYYSDEEGHWLVCDADGAKFDLEDHVFFDRETIEEPTCAESGSKVQECLVCGFDRTIEVPPLGHVETWEYDARTHKCVCSRCHATLKWEEQHRFDDGEIIGIVSCTSSHEVLYKCLDCGYSYQVTVEAKGHTSQSWEMNAERHWQICSACGEIFNDSPHVFDEGTITERPMADKEGVLLRTCEDCGYHIEEPVPYEYRIVMKDLPIAIENSSYTGGTTYSEVTDIFFAPDGSGVEGSIYAYVRLIRGQASSISLEFKVSDSQGFVYFTGSSQNVSASLTPGETTRIKVTSISPNWSSGNYVPVGPFVFEILNECEVPEDAYPEGW